MADPAVNARRLRWLAALLGAALIPAALIAGTWNQLQPLPPKYREAGTDRNLLGTPVAASERPGGDAEAQR
ncbi:MAG: hypothetical protein ACKOWF_09785 [Chloroflexota bacterium]